MRINNQVFPKAPLLHSTNEKKGYAYCQNAKCPHKHHLFRKSKMISINEYMFCSLECGELLKIQMIEN